MPIMACNLKPADSIVYYQDKCLIESEVTINEIVNINGNDVNAITLKNGDMIYRNRSRKPREI